MKLILQAFARMPETEPESHWLAYTILTLSCFAAGFLAGRFLSRRRSYNAGYMEGFTNGISAHKETCSAPTIKISPRNVILKEPFKSN